MNKRKRFSVDKRRSRGGTILLLLEEKDPLNQKGNSKTRESGAT
jgi:hypothetical protein